MSVGRGRGYLGRHRQRSPRPGVNDLEDEDSRGLAQISPKALARRGYSGRRRQRSPRPAVNYLEDKDGRRFVRISPKALANPLNVELPAESQKKEIETEMERKEDKERKWESKDKYQMSADDEAQLRELLNIEEQYAPLLTLLEQFSPGEDGIQFNRKLRHFETTVTNLCPDESRLQQAFATFRAAALQSAQCARKLAAVGASFTRQQRQQLLRGALLNQVMQGTFSKLDLLERANPTYLINAANLMGDYFAEARLCNGNKVHILASPLLQYMRALLASDDIRAHRSLATQLMQNGRELLSVLAQELNTLSIEIRLRLLSPPPVNVIWLLLSADICLNKFLPLPNILQQFYASHLELNTDSDYSEVSYGSWKKEDEQSLNQTQDLTDKVSQNLSQICLNHDEDTKPKLRPILGAGAGLLRQEQAMSVSQDTFENWTAKSSLTKRYDLNSWRQSEEEKAEDSEVFNPSVLPPTVQNFNPVTVPDYPPPNVRYNNYPENFANYLQQGDGAYIQNQYQNTQNFTSQGDFVPPYQNERQNDRQSFEKQPAPFTNVEKTEFVQTFPQERPMPEPVNNEVQKHASRRPIENWRKEKSDLKDDPNRNKPKNWIRQRSKDNVNDEEKETEKFKTRPINRVANRLNRRNSSESDSGSVAVKQPPKRHVTEVPRNHKYWDHDDRCDKDYNS